MSVKVGTILIPNPTQFVDRETGLQMTGYLPSGLAPGVRHRVAKVKQTGFGTMVKTDKHITWINLNWFRPE